MKTNASLLENAPTHIYTSSTCILQGPVSGGATGLEDRPVALPAKRGALLPAHLAPRGAGRRADSKSGHAADPRGGGGHGRTSLWEPSSPSPKDGPAGKLQRQAWGEREGWAGQVCTVLALLRQSPCPCPHVPEPQPGGAEGTATGEQEQLRLGPSPHCPTQPFVSS